MSARKYSKRAASIPEDESMASYSSGDEPSISPTRTYRFSASKRPRVSMVSVNPSPRVSTIDSPESGAVFDEDEATYDSTHTIQGGRPNTVLRCYVILLSIVIVLLMAAAAFLLATRHPHIYCHTNDGDFIIPRNLTVPNILDDLTHSEYSQVYNFLMNKSDLGLIRFDAASIDSNYIYMIELYPPSKESVLRFYSNHTSRPEREALVTIVFDSRDPPTLQQYVVSNTVKPTSIRKHDSIFYGMKSLDYVSKPLDRVEVNTLLVKVIHNVTEMLYPVLMRSYGLCYHNCTKGANCLNVRLSQVTELEGRQGRFTWAVMYSDSQQPFSYPLGLAFLIRHTSTNTRLWTVVSVLYDNREYGTVAELLSDFNESHIHKHTDGRGLFMDTSEVTNIHVQGPKLIEPEGRRFRIYGQNIIYKNWNFHFQMSPSHGLKVYNLLFNGTRIVYEISLQRLVTTYATHGLFGLFGESRQELVRGVDCPDTAALLHTTLFVNSEKANTVKNSICVFEMNAGVPLRRHSDNGEDGRFNYYYGAVDYTLIVRTITCLGGHDYILDYMFHNNGGLDIRVMTTGSPRIDSMQHRSFPSHKYITASPIAHMFTFRVDIDVAGTDNRFTTMTYRQQASLSAESSTPELVPVLNTFTSEGLLNNIDTTQPIHYLFHNTFEKNILGTDKAYTIDNHSPVDSVFTQLTKVPTWMNHPVIVTKHKQNEIVESPFLPVTNLDVSGLDSFVDGEDLLDTDLVAWVSIGASHLPGTEDIPAMSSTANACSFSINPHSYFSDSVSARSTDSVWIRSNVNSNSNTINAFRRSFETKCIPRSHGPFNYDGDRP